MREFVEDRAFRRAVISLPPETFFSSGASVKAFILFLEKFSDKEQARFSKLRAEARAEIEAKHADEIARETKQLNKAFDALGTARVPRAASGVAPDAPNGLNEGEARRLAKQAGGLRSPKDIAERRKALQRELADDQRAMAEKRPSAFKMEERRAPPKVFAAPWARFGPWSVSDNQQTLTGMNLEAGKYSIATLESLLTLVQYGTSEKGNHRGRGVPVLRIGNIKEGVVDMTDLKHIDLPEKALASLMLKDGDMLIIRTSGSRDLVGTSAVFHGSEPAVFASYLIRLRFDATRVTPDYVCWFLNSALGRQQVDSISRQIMQNNINSEEIRTLRLPLPPLDIQHRLVERVAAARAEMTRERAAAEQLRQTIVAEVEALILGAKPLAQA